ncbi:MAG: thioredoxin family protein [Planctomycetota bacterium]|nr:thioredoxin family protein [Planctomycetota bacterium]
MRYPILTAFLLAAFIQVPDGFAQEGTPESSTTQSSIPASIIIPVEYVWEGSSESASQDSEKPTKQKREPIYDEQADAEFQIKQALNRAKKENRRVLIQWGAIWCGWCYLLHDHFKEDKEVARKLLYEYDVVLVDIGDDGKKNRDLASKYNAALAGVPYLTVLDSYGEVIANQETGSLELQGEGKKGHDGKKVLAFLAEHQAPYHNAESQLAVYASYAKKMEKRVLLHFGAPWCGWCTRLEDWMARSDVAKVLDRHFVDAKIDIDRTIGGKELYRQLSEKRGRGIPWSAVLDENGEVVSWGFMKGFQNIGFPATDEEIEAFLAMLKKGAPDMTVEEHAILANSLKPVQP